MKKIDRLQFLQLAGGILGAGVATAAAACGGDDAAAGAVCNPSALVVNISMNHLHQMTVTAAQVSAAVRTSYDIQGKPLADNGKRRCTEQATLSALAHRCGRQPTTCDGASKSLRQAPP